MLVEASTPPGDGLVSPINGLPCLWYRYRVERKNGDHWEHVESGASHDTFGISDGSGQLLVDPDGAEIHDFAQAGLSAMATIAKPSGP